MAYFVQKYEVPELNIHTLPSQEIFTSTLHLPEISTSLHKNNLLPTLPELSLVFCTTPSPFGKIQFQQVRKRVIHVVRV